jgi:exonuclease III
LKGVLGHKLTQAAAATFILLGVYIIMYPPDIGFFKKTSEFAVHLMFGLLGLSFVFLVFNQKRLMFISMLACGLLAFYLKTASNSNMILPQVNNLPKFKIAHFNLSSFNAYDPSFEDIITNTECDFISFQEYTPDWHGFVQKTLLHKFKYHHTNIRIDPFGMAVYSKLPIEEVQTFHYKEIPNLDIKVNTGYQEIHIISSYIAPPTIATTHSVKDHLDAISTYVNVLDAPAIVLGDFNQVYWAKDIQNFREAAGLNNSRRNIDITTKVPYDHIFHTEMIECISFKEIKDTDLTHLGITGIFQPKSAITNPAILRSLSKDSY